MLYEKPLDVREHILNLNTGYVGDIADYLSYYYSEMSKKDAWDLAFSVLESMYDAGEVRLSYKIFGGRNWGFETTI